MDEGLRLKVGRGGPTAVADEGSKTPIGPGSARNGKVPSVKHPRGPE